MAATITSDYTTVKTENGLEAKVSNGKITKNETTTQKTADEMNSLGKESFLTLLCAQMQYQDPLEPEQNTEWISQLATYSSLEQMTNLNQTVNNSQAYGFIGKNVLVKDSSTAGDTYVTGKVDYVTLKDSKAYVNIKGTDYLAEKVEQVIGDEYLAKMLPSVDKQNIEYTKGNTNTLAIKVNLGSDEGKAEGIALTIDGNVVDKKYVKVSSGGIATLSSEALSELEAGAHKIGVKFSNKFNTEIDDAITLTVKEAKEDSETTKTE
ncbi:MAG: flagellar hook capping FlgD N-terminal domain-containing protein [Catonella sp.]|nr:flagellar hook capping FlgD N-terminal domain-containing protein [Catonella sp.]MDY6356178.1 flagellar hook capping FlgD N-terminal domain-containing protein [Catonella sp.]